MEIENSDTYESKIKGFFLLLEFLISPVSLLEWLTWNRGI